MDLDRTDVKILRALQDNARLSYRDLARIAGVSVPTISARVANLEQLGILRGYHAWVDVERLRQSPVVLVVRCRPAAVDSVGRALAAMAGIRWTVRTEGARILAEAVLRPSESVDEYLDRIRSIDGVLALKSYRAVKRIKDAPRAVIGPGLRATPNCFECGRAIEGEPVKLKLDGRNHYLCCTSCETLYARRYAKIRAAAGYNSSPLSQTFRGPGSSGRVPAPRGRPGGLRGEVAGVGPRVPRPASPTVPGRA